MCFKDLQELCLEKDPSQINFVKMTILGIQGCPDQDQEVGTEHINETKMFQLTSRESMELIDEGGDLVDLEDVLQSEQILDLAEQKKEEKADMAQLADLGEQPTQIY